MYFRFYGDSFDPDEITRRLGIQPTIRFRPGDPITKDGQGRRRGYGWMLKVDGRDTIEIADMLHELQQRVSVPAQKVREVCSDLGVEPVVICGVGQHEDADTTPALFFPADFIEWLNEMSASLNVDIVL
jgi:hypothetical protein